MSVVKISHKWQDEKTQNSCYFFPDSKDEQDEPLYCTCGHVWVTFSEKGTVMTVGADEGYDPVTIGGDDAGPTITICQREEEGGLPFVRLVDGKASVE